MFELPIHSATDGQKDNDHLINTLVNMHKVLWCSCVPAIYPFSYWWLENDGYLIGLVSTRTGCGLSGPTHTHSVVV